MYENKQIIALRELLLKVPKPQLHLHLDGSLSYKFIKNVMENIKTSDPLRFSKLFPDNICSLLESDIYDLMWSLKKKQNRNDGMLPNKCNWKVFDFCNQFLQTRKELSDAVCDLVTTMNENYGVDYIEIRFAPCLHTMCGLTQKEVVISAKDGFKTAKNELAKSGVEINGGIILCAIRSYPLKDAMYTLELVSDTAALGFDIAGDEVNYPLKLFTEVLKKAKEMGVNFTIHSGEWDAINQPSVKGNIELAVAHDANRIGHGLALRTAQQSVFDDIIAKGIFVEVCLTSNCANIRKCPDFRSHPISLMLSKGIKVAGLNCDNTFLSGNSTIGRPDPVGECVRALTDVMISPEDLFSCILNGYKSGFHPKAQSNLTAIADKWRNISPKIQEILDENFMIN